MLPINSKIRIGKVTGKQIKDRLKKELNNLLAKDTSERLGGWLIKFKGMKIFFNAFGEKEKRVQQIYVADAPLNPDKKYSICACEGEGDRYDMV